MKRSFILLLAATFSLFSFAQNHEVDPEVARAILEELDAKHESYKAMKVDFELTLDNRQRNTKDTHKGHLDVMGNKFHLDILNSETFSDGKVVYSYSKENNEVTISTIDEEEQASMDPLKILSSWHEGYKLRYLGDAEVYLACRRRTQLYMSRETCAAHTDNACILDAFDNFLLGQIELLHKSCASVN